MYKFKMIPGLFLISILGLSGCGPSTTESDQQTESSHNPDIIQYGSMREAIGDQQDQGRVRFAELVKQPHCYAVAALEGLKGEAAIVDGELTVSIVDDQGQLKSVVEDADQLQATMLAGSYVNQWHDIAVEQDVAAEEFDKFLAESAEASGVSTDKPFLFTVEGDFSDLHLHVINGACPVHARMQQQVLPAEVKPFEQAMPKISGTLVGIYARDAVGKLTQPATETHRHFVYEDDSNQKQVGHVEKGGILKGATLRIAN
ncbi:acetolactate decarboxylase [Mariniblastus fucicola]|uniref:Alpha-acetolactate decarboxylase n=1 Tax=Mariniblastus fucicola TaxID=980251 RepID=A0A5B9PI29_9BACT|nr:acetolactate decarboxylase [Mariniblastus fucicola]QEG22481.1 Alpha-acetolactate decarboxylase [Mariniblastus fucicola]